MSRIIDCHTHLISVNLTPRAYWDGWARVVSAASRRPVEKVKARIPDFSDEDGGLLISDMDKAGVDQSWIEVLDFGLSKAGESLPITELNQRYADIARKSNGRLVAFAGIDPRRENASDLLEAAVRDWGMRGLKLFPPAGFYPDSPECYQLYQKAAELSIPVLVHTGPEIAPFYSKYCQPVFMDGPAADFPDVNFILAHAGFCWWEEALAIAANKVNIYLELGGWQGSFFRNPVEGLFRPLRTMLDEIDASRVLFGSDWPAYRLFQGGEAGWVKALSDPPEAAKKAGITLKPEEIAAILGDNASRLISPPTP